MDEADKLASRDHPETSHEAAREIIPHLARMEKYAVECVRILPGSTRSELQRHFCPFNEGQIGKRLAACERKGFLVRGPARRCKITKKMAETWTVKE